jgi:hypothetical protein
LQYGGETQVNSEELELSLRTEFENYFKEALAGARQEVSGLQEKIEAELEKHKSQLDAVFQEFAARFDSDKALDPAFIESVVEHMRLARDEGARITATAIAEAESMEKETEAAPAAANFSEIRDAIVDISAKTSQSAILKSLIHHAAQFTPRGAFFIIKNEHFVGWRVFGKEGTSDEQAVREVFFPIASDTVLGQSVRALATAEGGYGTHANDADYLNKLEFGQPDKMYAIPLVARGRGVAVLYADYGNEGVAVNIEALETLVSIAGLTVELLAASQSAKAQPANEEAGTQETSHDLSDGDFAGDFHQPAAEGEKANAFVEEEHGFAYTPAPVEEETISDETEFAYEEEETAYAVEKPAFANEPIEEEPAAGFESETGPGIEEPAAVEEGPAYAWSEPVQEEAPAFESSGEEAAAEEETPVVEFSSGAVEYEFESSPGSFETVEEEEAPAAQTWETETFDHAPAYEPAAEPVVEEIAPAFESANGSSEVYTPHPEPIVETVSAQPVKTRFSDRNVDLPIEVAEDERRLHNDARRFARLLVSEVKLYNEQKVKEGRESKDLYDRLKEAIDRSREMYDKRVQPPVASKFDYFHYELVSTLAEGDQDKLGDSYPGASV